MWREVVLVLPGGECEQCWEAELASSFGAVVVKDRRYRLTVDDGGEVEIVFGVLDNEYTAEEHVELAEQVPDPRLVLVLYMEVSVLEKLFLALPDDRIMVDDEDPAGLHLLNPDAALPLGGTFGDCQEV